MAKLWPLIVMALVIGMMVLFVKLKQALKNGAPAAATDDEESPKETIDLTGYTKKKFLFSPAEYSFYKVLVLAVGTQYTIQSHVRIADFVSVEKGSAKWQSKVNRITRKHFDFLLCDPTTMIPQFAIELDDKSHSAQDRQERDNFVNALCTHIRFPLLHVQAARNYSPTDLQNSIAGLLKAA